LGINTFLRQQVTFMTLVYHECGNPLWLEGRRYGDTYLAKIFDGREEGNGQKVLACPTCGEELANTVSEEDRAPIE